MKFLVLVTFDLNYCKTPEYRLMEKTLTALQFETSSHRSGLDLPNNTYLGVIEIEGGELNVSEIKKGAEKAVEKISAKLRDAIKGTGKTGKFYVTASPKNMTIDYCSR